MGAQYCAQACVKVRSRTFNLGFPLSLSLSLSLSLYLSIYLSLSSSLALITACGASPKYFLKYREPIAKKVSVNKENQYAAIARSLVRWEGGGEGEGRGGQDHSTPLTLPRAAQSCIKLTLLFPSQEEGGGGSGGVGGG